MSGSSGRAVGEGEVLLLVDVGRCSAALLAEVCHDRCSKF